MMSTKDSSGDPAVSSQRTHVKHNTFKVAFVIVSYWVVSISTVFMNKFLLSGNDFKIHVPLIVTWLQCLVSVVFCVCWKAVSLLCPTMLSFPTLAIQPKVMIKVVPVTLAFVAMITFNNLCLKYLAIAFYNRGRAMTLVFSLVISRLILRQHFTLGSVLCCLAITVGYLWGISKESQLGAITVVGISFGLAASLSLSFSSVFTKLVLHHLSHDAWRLAWINNVCACMLFLPLIKFSGELDIFLVADDLHNLTFATFIVVSGVLGFLVGFSSSLQIKYTSPVSHIISGVVKAILQSQLALWYFGQRKPFSWYYSAILVMAGSVAYAHLSFRNRFKNKPSASHVVEIPHEKLERVVTDVKQITDGAKLVGDT